MSKSRRFRNKPQIRVVRKRDDGSEKVEFKSWDEAYGDIPESAQPMLEHTYLQNQILANESDRAVAVLGPAYLDSLLEDVLRARLADKAGTEALLSGDAPLGTFAAKIDMLHALGLLADDAYNDLHLIRKLRNEFAHVVDRHSLDDPEVRDRCRHLKLHQRWPSSFPDLSKPGHVRQVFLFTIWALVVELSSVMHTPP